MKQRFDTLRLRITKNGGVGNGSTTKASVLFPGLLRNDLRYLLRHLEAHSNLRPVLRGLRRVSDHGVDTMAFLLLSFSIRFLGSQRPLEYQRTKCTGLTILPVRRRSQRRSSTISFEGLAGSLDLLCDIR